jgi:peptide/nickel transport system permease protein
LQAFVAPTVSVTPFSAGPLPLGSLSTESPSTPEFFNIAEGLIKGSTWTLGIAASIVALGAIIGLFLGAFSGYRGGTTDEVIMRTTDIFLSIPGLLLVLVLLAVLETAIPGLTFEDRVLILIFAFVVTWWPTYARIVRSQVFVTREQKYVEAARASGAKTGRLLFRHIIPNSVYPVFVQMALDVGAIPLLIGAIIFLGFTIWPTEYFPEWGTMSALSILPITSAVETCSTAIAGQGTCLFPWWQLLFPGLAVFLFAISVNFFGDGLRDALDPRLRR